TIRPPAFLQLLETSPRIQVIKGPERQADASILDDERDAADDDYNDETGNWFTRLRACIVNGGGASMRHLSLHTFQIDPRLLVIMGRHWHHLAYLSVRAILA